jgi:hypothetical protein
MPEQRPPSRVGEVAPILGAGDADITEAPLLLELGLAPAVDGTRMRKDALLHARQEHDRELEPLDGVHGDQRRRRLRVLIFVDVGDEGDFLEEARQLLVVR